MVVSPLPLRARALIGVTRAPLVVPPQLEGELHTRLGLLFARRAWPRLKLEVVDAKAAKVRRGRCLAIPVPRPVILHVRGPRPFVLKAHLFARAATPGPLVSQEREAKAHTVHGRRGRRPLARAEAARVTTPALLESARGPAAIDDGGSQVQARTAAHGPVVGACHAQVETRAPVPAKPRHAPPATAG